jgi:hypothetical protein
MSRWLLVSCCLMVLGAVAHIGPTRAADARPLGGVCGSDRDCQYGLSCASETGVMERQCSAVCNVAAACQDSFGAESMCLGADLCARTCADDAGCPSGTSCNAYGWCERAPR